MARKSVGRVTGAVAALFVVTAFVPATAKAIDGVYHSPYGQDDLYSTEVTERAPRDPQAGQTVTVKLTTWPVEMGQATWLTWTKNGLSQPDVGGQWQDLKKWYTDPSSIWNAITTDVSMLGVVVPFAVLPADDSRVVNTVNELEPALTDSAEMGQAVGGVARYRQDQTSRYGSTYANYGDAYYDGGPWMVATTWLSQYYLKRANTSTGSTYANKAKAYTDWVMSYLGNVGIGAEQIDETKGPDQFAHQAAWGNGWESNASIVDNLLAYIDYTYSAANNQFIAWPKIPSSWTFVGANVKLKNGKLNLKVTKVSGSQTRVELTNNTLSNLSLEIYAQTDASPTSVTGTGLSWTYNAANGRVKLYGTLNSGVAETITINH